LKLRKISLEPLTTHPVTSLINRPRNINGPPPQFNYLQKSDCFPTWRGQDSNDDKRLALERAVQCNSHYYF